MISNIIHTPQMAGFNWNNFYLSSQAGIDEHWLDGELYEELDLQPVLAPNIAPTVHAAAGAPVAVVAATPPAANPPTNTTAPAA
jgi:hypothetical protein